MKPGKKEKKSFFFFFFFFFFYLCFFFKPQEIRIPTPKVFPLFFLLPSFFFFVPSLFSFLFFLSLSLSLFLSFYVMLLVSLKGGVKNQQQLHPCSHDYRREGQQHTHTHQIKKEARKHPQTVKLDSKHDNQYFPERERHIYVRVYVYSGRDSNQLSFSCRVLLFLFGFSFIGCVEAVLNVSSRSLTIDSTNNLFCYCTRLFIKILTSALILFHFGFCFVRLLCFF